MVRYLFEIKKRSQIAFEYQEWLHLSFNKKRDKNLDQQATVNGWVLNLKLTFEACARIQIRAKNKWSYGMRFYLNDRFNVI